MFRFRCGNYLQAESSGQVQWEARCVLTPTGRPELTVALGPLSRSPAAVADARHRVARLGRPSGFEAAVNRAH